MACGTLWTARLCAMGLSLHKGKKSKNRMLRNSSNRFTSRGAYALYRGDQKKSCSGPCGPFSIKDGN